MKYAWKLPHYQTETSNIGGKLIIYSAFLYELYYNWRGEISLFGNISTDTQWKMIEVENHHSAVP